MPDPRSGILLVLMQPPATLEEEFNAWYDTEHIPERANVAGFETALRYVALSGYPRFMAIYDLQSLSVLDTPEYHAVAGPNFSPWTKRVTSRVQIYRIAAEQIYPGNALTRRSSRIALVRLRAVRGASEGTVVKALKETFEARKEIVNLRIFKRDNGPDIDYFCLAGATPPPIGDIDLLPLGALVSHVDMVNIYAPYAIAD